MGKFLTVAIFLLVSFYVKGQDKLEPERPGETKSPELVRGNHLQIEAGFLKEKISDNQNLYQHPDVTVRYGLFNAIELRMDVISQTVRNTFTKESFNGIKPILFGVKAKVLPEHKWSPSIGVLGMVGIPSTASINYYNKRVPIEFRTLFANTFNKKLKLQYNVGMHWEGDDRRTQWMYSIRPMYEITDDLSAFVEEYAFLRDGIAAQHYIDGGLQYFLGKNFAVDVSGGAGLSTLSSSYIIAAGLSLQLPMK